MADVTFVCPNCGQPVSYATITFTDGSSVQSLDWECKNCHQQVIQLQRQEETEKLTLKK